MSTTPELGGEPGFQGFVQIHHTILHLPVTDFQSHGSLGHTKRPLLLGDFCARSLRTTKALEIMYTAWPRGDLGLYTVPRIDQYSFIPLYTIGFYVHVLDAIRFCLL